MNNRELEEILKSAGTPERPEEYWRDFPRRVSAKLHWKAPSPAVLHEIPARNFRPWLLWGLGLAAVLVAIGIVARFQGKPATPVMADSQLAEAQKCYHELIILFPNQIEAIVFDQQGPRLVLADRANVPDSTPIYLKICGPKGCEGFVTFSGQRIIFNGEDCEVLADAQGQVMLVGDHQVWSQGDRSEAIRIQATALNDDPKDKGKSKI